LAGGFDDGRGGSIAWGIGDGDVDTEAAGGEQEGMGDVVSVPDIGQLEALPPAESFADGLDVSEDLARVVEIAEGVDDRDTGPAGEFFDRVLGEDSGDDAVGPTVEVAGDIGEGLAVPDRADLGDGATAELLDGEVKSEASAEGWFLEQQAEVATAEGLGEVGGAALDLFGEGEEAGEFFERKVEVRLEIGGEEGRANGERGGGEGHDWDGDSWGIKTTKGTECLFSALDNYTRGIGKRESPDAGWHPGGWARELGGG